jgi:hypothetical protein
MLLSHRKLPVRDLRLSWGDAEDCAVVCSYAHYALCYTCGAHEPTFTSLYKSPSAMEQTSRVGTLF